MIVALCGSREIEDISAIAGGVVSAGGVIIGVTGFDGVVTVVVCVGTVVDAGVVVSGGGVDVVGDAGIGVLITTGVVSGGGAAGVLGAMTGAAVPFVSTLPASCARAGAAGMTSKENTSKDALIARTKCRCFIIKSWINKIGFSYWKYISLLVSHLIESMELGVSPHFSVNSGIGGQSPFFC
jgi:hypothetical protein